MKKRIKTSQPWFDDEEKRNINHALDQKAISGFYGNYIAKFENLFAKFCDSKYGVSTNSGTTALHLATKTLDIRKGDEVLVTTFTNMASIFSILYVGAKPIPIDIDEDTFNIDPKLIEKKINKRTKAIMIVHIFGHPVDYSAISLIAKKYKLLVIEDCAEAHGAEYKGKKVGSLGDAGCFSFYANKIITTGEGGMVVFNNKKLAEKAKNLKELSFGKVDKFQHNDIGFNYRMTNLQAALAVAQLERIDELLDKKIEIFSWYHKYLNNINGIKLNPKLENYKNVYWMICVELTNLSENERDNVMVKLNDKYIDSRPYFYPISEMPMYTKVNTPVTKLISQRGINLPSYFDLTEDQVLYICNELKKLL